MGNTVKEYYNIYFFPYTDIPYSQVSWKEKRAIKESVSYAKWMVAFRYKESVTSMAIAISKMTTISAADMINDLIKPIK